MDNIKVETLTEAEINWEPCYEIRNEEDIPIEYVQVKEIYSKSPEKRRTVIVPKSELGSEYDYIREADITLCDTTIDVDVNTKATCEICKFTPSQPSQQRSVEQQAKMCNKCSTKYLLKVDLPKRRVEQKQQKHSHTETTRAKTFKCDNCHKILRSQSALTGDKLIHTGEKPHRCNVCKKRFRTQVNLYNHQQIHNDEKPFECYECSYQCRRLPTLKRHMLIHSGEKLHQCDQCQRKFRIGFHLKRHKLIHTTGERPFSCTVCPKKFKTSNDRREHMRIHTGVVYLNGISSIK